MRYTSARDTRARSGVNQGSPDKIILLPWFH
jgi:hypothetical protein